MTLTSKQYATILGWCNRVRAQLGAGEVAKLHKGKPHDAASCTLTKTINHRVTQRKRIRVDETEVYRGEDPFEPEEVVAKTPRYVEMFIREFDRGDYPELVGRGWAGTP